MSPPGPIAISGPRRPPAHSVGGHVRAAGLFLVAMIFVAGFAYPLALTGSAEVLDPHAAGGSLLYHNGTLVGSSLVAQNLSRPYLFWERPSLTDYSFLNGSPSPPGPSDPALRALINETLGWMRAYGNLTVNATVPIWWAAPSASSMDPDLVPEAVLVQIPRVAVATNLSIADLQSFVNKHIVTSVVPYFGISYVDVLELDLALLPLIGR